MARARINCQDQIPAQAGRGRLACLAGALVGIMENHQTRLKTNIIMHFGSKGAQDVVYQTLQNPGRQAYTYVRQPHGRPNPYARRPNPYANCGPSQLAGQIPMLIVALAAIGFFA